MPGDYFGEVAALLEQPPSADVVADSEMRCLILGGADLRELVLAHPKFALRMLEAEARKVRGTADWR